MTLHPEPMGPIPEETLRVARAAFPKGNIYMRMRDELGALYTDEDFADLFPSCGQVALAPWRLALVSVMQFAENLTDRQAADAVRARIDWKYALGLELTDPGFNFSVLSEFRARLVGGQAEQRVLDLMIERFRARQLLKGRGRQRTDSTAIVGAIRMLNRLELAGETMRQVLNALADAAPTWLKGRLRPDWADRYSKPVSDYHLPTTPEARQALAEVIGADGLYLLNQIYGPDTPVAIRSLPEVETMRQVWLQSFYQDEGQVRWRIRDNLPPSERLIVSPYDVDARAGYKRASIWHGYKVHLTETCDEETPHLITHVETTLATEPDMNLLEAIHLDLAQHDLLPREHLVDAGYVTAPLLVSSQRDYAIDLIGPIRPDPNWQARAKLGFDITHFTVNWDEHTITCPQGKTSWRWTTGVGCRGKPHLQVHFKPEDCQPCPGRSLCTRSKNGVRQLTIPPQAEYQARQNARAYQATQAFRDRYAARAGIEGTISQAAVAFEMRRTRYRGFPQVHTQHLLTAAALNLTRVVAWLEGKPRVKTRSSTLARLMTA